MRLMKYKIYLPGGVGCQILYLMIVKHLYVKRKNVLSIIIINLLILIYVSKSFGRILTNNRLTKYHVGFSTKKLLIFARFKRAFPSVDDITDDLSAIHLVGELR